MEIRRSEPFSGNSAAGDGLEVSARRIDFDRFFLEELLAGFGLPEMTESFLTGEEKGFVELAGEKRRLGFLDFEEGPATTAFGEENLGDVEERIDAGDLMDFLADEVDGLGIRQQSHAHDGSGSDVLALGRSAAAILATAVTTTAALILSERPALIAATRC